MKTQKTVEQIIGEHYEVYADHLENYKKMGIGWDEYAYKVKLTFTLRREFARIIKELNLNGYYGPETINGQIVCYIAVERSEIKVKFQHDKYCKCLKCNERRTEKA